MNWYLKRSNGELYGPVNLPTLQLWAMDGRVSPDDKISADQKEWMPSFDLAELSMVWKVELGDGSMYGPIHLLALRDLIHDGSVSCRAKIKHKQSGEERVACEALLIELIQTESKAQSALTELTDQLAHAEKSIEKLQQDLQNASERESKLREEIKKLTTKQDIGAPATREPTAEIQDLREQVNKWKTLYEEEQAAAATREARFKHPVHEQKRATDDVHDMVPRARLEDAVRKLSQIENHYRQLLKTLNRSFQAWTPGRPIPPADTLQRRDIS